VAEKISAIGIVPAEQPPEPGSRLSLDERMAMEKRRARSEKKQPEAAVVPVVTPREPVPALLLSVSSYQAPRVEHQRTEPPLLKGMADRSSPGHFYGYGKDSSLSLKDRVAAIVGDMNVLPADGSGKREAPAVAENRPFRGPGNTEVIPADRLAVSLRERDVVPALTARGDGANNEYGASDHPVRHPDVDERPALIQADRRLSRKETEKILPGTVTSQPVPGAEGGRNMMMTPSANIRQPQAKPPAERTTLSAEMPQAAEKNGFTLHYAFRSWGGAHFVSLQSPSLQMPVLHIQPSGGLVRERIGYSLTQGRPFSSVVMTRAVEGTCAVSDGSSEEEWS